MTKKFTEEQYQGIIKAWRSEHTYAKGTQDVIDYLLSIDMKFMVNETLAIANPLTREWAHDEFVEKENKYYWTSKKEDRSGFVKRIYKDRYGMISDHSMMKSDLETADTDEQLTESEIREWGYNPDMFDKK